MLFTVTIEQDESGWYTVHCPTMPGCVSQGPTREEAMANIREAIALCVEARCELGLPLRVETEQVDVAV